VRAKFPDDYKEPSSRKFRFNFADDHMLEPEQFIELLLSNQRNKYDRLVKELDTGAELSFIFKKLKYQQMVRSGIIQKGGKTYINQNKVQKDQYFLNNNYYRKEIQKKRMQKSIERSES